MDRLNRKLNSKDTQELLKKHTIASGSIYRTKYHVQTVCGLMNDPNGFCYYQNAWHLFYQWYPYEAAHGLKHWYHVESPDLVHWKNDGLFLKPDTWYENNGCFSGSAIVEGEDMFVAYTGHNKDEKGNIREYQLLAKYHDSGIAMKLNCPIIEPHPDYITKNQRDPKVFKEGDTYYILLGAQDAQKHGKFLLYSSKDLTDGWKFQGELKVQGYPYFGYMVECPCITKIGDMYVLLFSPQGLEAKGEHYNNKFNNVYLLGNLDLENLTFTPHSDIQELDRGFDFYAAQCAFQTTEKDKAYLAGWFGVSDYQYPQTEKEYWVGLQTLPRVLTISNDTLLQSPPQAMESLKNEILFEAKNGNVVKNALHAEMPRCCKIEVDNPKDNALCFNLFTWGRNRGFEIRYDAIAKKLSINKSDMHSICNLEFGTVRTVTLSEGCTHLDIYVDQSTVEIFVNNGETVLSSRIFPDKTENQIRMEGSDIDVHVYSLLPSIKDDFVL